VTERIDSRERQLVRRRLRSWYSRRRRDLAWRRTKDPYAVLVSEVMLQQTTVRVVEPYFLRFMERYPDVRSLARSSEEDVLSIWSGLGYYRRARNLRHAARMIEDDHGGSFPTDERSVRQLPGVGRYTAGAVLSIAFDAPLPVLDGNVARVLSRLFAVPGDPRSAGTSRRLWELAAGLVPQRGAGDHNQSLMELGALVCLPANPRCDECPVESACRARREGSVGRYPGSSPRPAGVKVLLASALAVRGGRVLLEMRRGVRLLDRMWELPTATVGVAPAAGLASALAERGLRGIRIGAPVAEVRHSITHRRLTVTIFEAAAPRVPSRRESPFGWCDPNAEIALTGLARKSLRATGLLEG